MTILLYILVFLCGVAAGLWLMRKIVFEKMNVAASAIYPALQKNNEFSAGCREAARAIFGEFGLAFKNVIGGRENE